MTANIDATKLQIIIQDGLDRLTLLQSLRPDNELSSDLAGHEIAKLLQDQGRLEAEYADLVHLRTSLIGITKKQQLLETQTKIHNVARQLKDSTKKLCRLFKENPDLAKDGRKIQCDIEYLKEKLEQLMKFIMENQQNKFFAVITDQLNEQDKLRKLNAMEKDLILDKKKIEAEKAYETKEYHQDMQEKQSYIQEQKDKKAKKALRAELKHKYALKEAKAFVDQKQLIFKAEENRIMKEIKQEEEKVKIEKQVNEDLKAFLNMKEDELKEESIRWSNLTEEMRTQLEEKSENKRVEMEEIRAKVETEKTKKAQYQFQQMQAEQKEAEELAIKQQEELQKIRLENAIKMIQADYIFITGPEGRGFGKKKKKKKKPQK